MVGIDVAKRKHVAVAEHDGHFGKPLRFDNDSAGFEALAAWFERLSPAPGTPKLVVGLEATGVYGRALEHWLLSRGVDVQRVPPLLTCRAKEMLDRSPTKNDPKDAAVIADLVRQGKGDPYQLSSEVFETLRTLGTLRHGLGCSRGATLNRLHRVLDQVFPELPGLFDDLAQPTCRALLRRAATPKAILELGEDALADLLTKASRGKIRGERARALIDVAACSVGNPRAASAHGLEITLLLDQLDSIDAQITRVEAEQVATTEEVPYANLLASVPGISLATVATILGETGDLRNYQHAQQLVKMAGLNLKERSSGEKKGKMAISRRGRPRLRHALYLAVIRMVGEKGPLHESYVRMRSSKPGLVAIVAGMRRLLRALFAMVRDAIPFDPVRLGATSITLAS